MYKGINFIKREDNLATVIIATKKSPMPDNINLKSFVTSLFQYNRNPTVEVRAGDLKIGGLNPVRLQSMTTTNTLDTDATVEQCIKIFDAGGELVRITAQGKREASNLFLIRKILNKKGYSYPLAADIHFNSEAASVAATFVEKVRINPGNFAGGAKKIQKIAYTDELYLKEVDDIKKVFVPFLKICSKNGTAIRIGVNHGSLSDRIMSKYGDTPIGMVESCMEYLRICRDENFNNVVVSIKSSNTRVMVHTVRLLNYTMKAEGMKYPLHLGVTEAGMGEDGRIKSAVGIGALLADGLGDTIRVSLTEDPELEIPVADRLKKHFESFNGHNPIKAVPINNYQPFEYKKRETHSVIGIGGMNHPWVITDLRGYNKIPNMGVVPDAVILDNSGLILPNDISHLLRIVPFGENIFNQDKTVLPLCTIKDISDADLKKPGVLQLGYEDLSFETIEFLRNNKNIIILLETGHVNGVAEQRAFFLALLHFKITNPVIVQRKYLNTELSAFQIDSAADTGLLFIDGFGEGLSLVAPALCPREITETAFGILQASRARFSKTEYISCPGCGRTLFNLQSTTELIKARTSHLKGIKIAIMGCIVNGIGEMADADYGYVGAGAGRISLFKNRELVIKNMPQSEAVERLIELIKDDGHWLEP